VGGGQIHAQQARVPLEVGLGHKVEPGRLVDPAEGDAAGRAQAAWGEVCAHIPHGLPQFRPAGRPGHVYQWHGNDPRPLSYKIYQGLKKKRNMRIYSRNLKFWVAIFESIGGLIVVEIIE
jgi:hypothetical protein